MSFEISLLALVILIACVAVLTGKSHGQSSVGHLETGSPAGETFLGPDVSPDLEQHPEIKPRTKYTLDPDWDFNAELTKREYHWTITDDERNPDGVYRPMILINGEFPGPMIECNEGDPISVHVHNQAVNATSFHWHGIYQNGSNWMDGTVGITQCPIAPGANMTYEFKIQGQSGTYWYHAHMAMQGSDGLAGPLIVHAKNERDLQKLEYASDQVVMIQDYYHDLTSALLPWYLASDRENEEPVPDGGLINGRNVRDCDALPDRRCDNSTAGLSVFELEPEKTHRLRIIHTGAFAEFQVQLDEHQFAVTEADGTDVDPAYYHRLNINPGQRYSIILTTNVTSAESFWLRAKMVTSCFTRENPNLVSEVKAIIKYSSDQESKAQEQPSSKDWADATDAVCLDMNVTELHPSLPMAAPANADKAIYLRSNFEIGDWRLSRGFFNQSSWRAPLSSPSLHRFIDGYSTQNESFTSSLSAPFGVAEPSAFDISTEFVYQTTGIQTLDIIVSNFDDGNHPLHLHGYKYFVLASGHGYPPDSLLSDPSKLDTTNPLRRDTASVEGFGWIWLRLVADNPGVWAFHCHIGWHTEAGMLMQFATRVDEMVGWEVTEEQRAHCEAEGIEKGMTPGDETWFGDFGDQDHEGGE
ncbi:multicopper oxidase [Saccharata proteae CBS 121410]|uniref:Multicopper oxidase n=1 Tax=Saccharata proteae CBS 121410 TaxID=1314787 RepID=A0A6A5YBD9_9PEZI|nr:multicopper oxidase [Saccharata proteae CBS 121410]